MIMTISVTFCTAFHIKTVCDMVCSKSKEYFVVVVFDNLANLITDSNTLFPRIMVHALKYETEAIVHAPKESPI